LYNPQSLNLYIYVLDRPTSLKDPSGLDWWNPWSWTPQQQAQAFTIAVVVVAVVAVVGSGMKGTPGVAARIFTAVARRKVNVRMVAQGSSEYNVSFVVSHTDGPKAVRAIHEEFNLGN